MVRPAFTNRSVRFYKIIFNYTQQSEEKNHDRGLFLSEPKKEETHYSIYEDSHGTHIFANNDINLMLQLAELDATGFQTWKLDGIYTRGAAFVAIAKLFAQAKSLVESGKWQAVQAAVLSEQVAQLHPAERGLDTGFYAIDLTISSKEQEQMTVKQALKRPEVLAPAGTLEKLKTAIHYGADAVISAAMPMVTESRGYFTYEEMAEGVAFAKAHNAKVYVAANMVTHEGNQEGAGEILSGIARCRYFGRDRFWSRFDPDLRNRSAGSTDPFVHPS